MTSASIGPPIVSTHGNTPSIGFWRESSYVNSASTLCNAAGVKLGPPLFLSLTPFYHFNALFSPILA